MAEHATDTALGVRTIFNAKPKDMPIYIPGNSVYQPDELVAYIKKYDSLPPPRPTPRSKQAYELWQELPKTDQAVGAILEYSPKRGGKRILVVQTHKWDNRWSIIGQRLQPGDTLLQTLFKEIVEETQNRIASNPRLVTAFDQIPNSGYRTHLTFTDYAAEVDIPEVKLNGEAQDYAWAPVGTILNEFNLEPNARRSLEIYAAQNS